jgi:hypothetical protein
MSPLFDPDTAPGERRSDPLDRTAEVPAVSVRRPRPARGFRFRLLAQVLGFIGKHLGKKLEPLPFFPNLGKYFASAAPLMVFCRNREL